jgi:5-methylcytosine-specific restriction endonuclease McrA
MEIQMRSPCNSCGSSSGSIQTRNGQDCVYCNECEKYQYNAPKTETGRAQRTVQTTHKSIKPRVRSQVIERSNGRCERCGKHALESETGLHVGHVLSVDEGHRQGLKDDVINSMENLIAECDECNLGHGKGVLPVRLLLALLTARSRMEV